MSLPGSTPEQRAILIVDEDTDARLRLRTIFEEAGYRALALSDAPSALSVVHEERCDIVLLDLETPGVDGFALCRLLRAHPPTSKVPIIALSSSEAENSS